MATNSADDSGGSCSQVPAPPPAPPSFREQTYWAVLGIGCTWVMGDSIFLEVPWWVNSQPDGLMVGSRMALASSWTWVTVLSGLMLRTFFPTRFNQVIVPTMILFSLVAGFMLGFGLWRFSSTYIYLSVLLSQLVGSMIPFGVLPWMLSRSFKPALISSLYCGGSITSLTASLIAVVQSPGGEQRFTPDVFFLILTSTFFASAAAFLQITFYSIGNLRLLEEEGLCDSAQQPHILSTSTTQGSGHECGVRNSRRLSVRCPQNLPQWLRSALLLALVSASMAQGSWTVLRAALPYATTHVVPGHAACSPTCSAFCADLSSEACESASACRWSVSDGNCRENRGEHIMQWTISLAQWSFAAGSYCTIILPTMRIFVMPILWLIPFLCICTIALVRDGLFEFASAGVFLVCSFLLARFLQGYFEVMQYRYIAYKHGQDAASVTVFVGVVTQAINCIAALLCTLAVELNVFSD
eukprot:TRINITY_DN73542_c0_g1_i1.p1 TRINITY_DN73542_c0_g1~~TRINITY_DN73542_c0_g1_i1.p1  ORF type:complete len:491 (-),score=38.53 TRINITY_DN73542_c0_g1_i1:166-1572(-)